MKPSLSVIAYINICRTYSANAFAFVIRIADNCKTVTSITKPPNAILLLFCFASVALSQTTIVAARNSVEVVVAADSLSHLGSTRGPTMVTCKIHACGDFYVGMAGPVVGRFKFDASKLLRRACEGTGNSSSKLKAIEKIFLPDYTRMIQETKRAYPTYYASAVVTKELYLNLIMVGFEGGLPFIASRDFSYPTLVFAPAIPELSRDESVGSIPEGGIQYFYGGHTKGIDEFTKTRNVFSLGVVEGVKFLIMYAIADEPLDVGPPIDILRITSKGAEWIKKKPECEEKEEKPKPKSQ